MTPNGHNSSIAPEGARVAFGAGMTWGKDGLFTPTEQWSAARGFWARWLDNDRVIYSGDPGTWEYHVPTQARTQIVPETFSELAAGGGQWAGVVSGKRLRMPDGTVKLGRYFAPRMSATGDVAYCLETSDNRMSLYWNNVPIRTGKRILQVQCAPGAICWTEASAAGQESWAKFGDEAVRNVSIMGANGKPVATEHRVVPVKLGETWWLLKGRTWPWFGGDEDEPIVHPLDATTGFIVQRTRARAGDFTGAVYQDQFFHLTWGSGGLKDWLLNPATGVMENGVPAETWTATPTDLRVAPVVPAVVVPLGRSCAVWTHFYISDRPQVKDDPHPFPQNCTWIESVPEFKRAYYDQKILTVVDARKPALIKKPVKDKCYAFWLSSPDLDTAERDTALLKKKLNTRKPIISYVDKVLPPTRKPTVAILGLAIYPKVANEHHAIIEARWAGYLATLPKTQKVALIGRSSVQFKTDTVESVKGYVSVVTRLARKFPNVWGIGWFSDEPSRGLRKPDLAQHVRPVVTSWFKTVKGRP